MVRVFFEDRVFHPITCAIYFRSTMYISRQFLKIRHPSSHDHTLLDLLDLKKVLFPFFLKFKVNYLTLSALVSLSGRQTNFLVETFSILTVHNIDSTFKRLFHFGQYRSFSYRETFHFQDGPLFSLEKDRPISMAPIGRSATVGALW